MIVELVVIAAALPFVAVADWLRFIKRMPPHEAELARASHGAALAVIASVLAVWLHMHGLLQNRYLIGGLAAVAAFGLYWLGVSARHARYRTERQTVRALTKFAVGVGAAVAVMNDVAGQQGWPPAVVELCNYALILFAIWCCVTGAVKFLLPILGSGSARRAAEREVRRRNAPMRPARG